MCGNVTHEKNQKSNNNNNVFEDIDKNLRKKEEKNKNEKISHCTPIQKFKKSLWWVWRKMMGSIIIQYTDWWWWSTPLNAIQNGGRHTSCLGDKMWHSKMNRIWNHNFLQIHWLVDFNWYTKPQLLKKLTTNDYLSYI